MKVLVIDDSVTMRRIIVNALQRIGYADAVEASGGTEALEKFDARIAFVIINWSLTNAGGMEMTKAIRAHPAGASVPILMVTTRGAREDIVSAVEAGVNNYILKPFTPSVLREKIERLLAGMGAAA